MGKVIIVLDADGKYVTVYCNEEIDLEVLKQGVDDDKIESAETIMEEVQI